MIIQLNNSYNVMLAGVLGNRLQAEFANNRNQPQAFPCKVVLAVTWS
jgi:hypothetical protein